MRTVAEHFAALTDALQPTPTGIFGARAHISSIEARLRSRFELRKTLLIGSTSRDTSIRSYSDVDLLALLSRDEARHGDRLVNSNTFLGRVRDDLNDRYHATKVRRDNQAVVLHFAQGGNPVDVVPAIFHEFRNKSPVYWIPDGNGGWLETAPEAHGTYLKKANFASGHKLRKTVQLLKHWKNCRENSVTLSSIHLELLLASHNVCVGIKSYATCLYEAFSLLQQRECRGLQDPVGVAGVLYACQTDSQWGKLMSAVNYAQAHAASAINAEAKGNHAEACRQWGIVFNGIFPSVKH